MQLTSHTPAHLDNITSYRGLRLSQQSLPQSLPQPWPWSMQALMLPCLPGLLPFGASKVLEDILQWGLPEALNVLLAHELRREKEDQDGDMKLKEERDVQVAADGSFSMNTMAVDAPSANALHNSHLEQLPVIVAAVEPGSLKLEEEHSMAVDRDHEGLSDQQIEELLKIQVWQSDSQKVFTYYNKPLHI